MNNDYKVVENKEQNGVELYFNAKPQASVLSMLKENGFRWNYKKSCWWSKVNEGSDKLLNALKKTSIEVGETITSKKPLDYKAIVLKVLEINKELKNDKLTELLKDITIETAKPKKVETKKELTDSEKVLEIYNSASDKYKTIRFSEDYLELTNGAITMRLTDKDSYEDLEKYENEDIELPIFDKFLECDKPKKLDLDISKIGSGSYGISDYKFSGKYLKLAYDLLGKAMKGKVVKTKKGARLVLVSELGKIAIISEN